MGEDLALEKSKDTKALDIVILGSHEFLDKLFDLEVLAIDSFLGFHFVGIEG